jgi:hypothetical protein
MPASEVRKLPHAQEGGTCSTCFGVYGNSETDNSYLTNGETFIQFYKYNGESDDLYGSNAWTLQLNTNQWIGANSETYEAQFYDQNDGSSNSYCASEVNVSTHFYGNTQCLSYTGQTLSSSYQADVTGKISGGNIVTTFCQPVSQNCASVNQQDVYGLASHWTGVSGTILGYGDGSTADFTSSTDVLTVAYSSSATSAIQDVTKLTDEQNNLSAGSATTSCNGGTCATSWHATD